MLILVKNSFLRGIYGYFRNFQGGNNKNFRPPLSAQTSSGGPAWNPGNSPIHVILCLYVKEIAPLLPHLTRVHRKLSHGRYIGLASQPLSGSSGPFLGPNPAHRFAHVIPPCLELSPKSHLYNNLLEIQILSAKIIWKSIAISNAQSQQPEILLERLKRRGHLTIIELLINVVVSGCVLQVEKTLGILLGVPALCSGVNFKISTSPLWLPGSQLKETCGKLTSSLFQKGSCWYTWNTSGHMIFLTMPVYQLNQSHCLNVKSPGGFFSTSLGKNVNLSKKEGQCTWANREKERVQQSGKHQLHTWVNIWLETGNLSADSMANVFGIKNFSLDRQFHPDVRVGR